MIPAMAFLRHILIACAVTLTLAGIGAAGPLHGAGPAPDSAVWFGLYFIDTSTEGAINGVREDETLRIEMAEDVIAEDLQARGFTLIEPPADQVAQIRNPSQSNGSDSRIAREMGATYAISGEVQKVSNLILSLNLYIREAASGEIVRAGTVDIRGNNDESFRRGYRYLLKNIIFREEQG
ncbi:hypothetical protein GCM10017635_36330 [Paracoccus kondratievae]|uniref:DUF2380 domain-containing protein n=2 Tax=Paracoccaceae TaxID=31989 RepID=A0AAD3P2V6_9RHOB|nr:hypothetical protein GCM10017635_36330 [Paracoccus kondratievae]SMG42340.1 Protein of unknown function [Paracoccus sp. J56]